MPGSIMNDDSLLEQIEREVGPIVQHASFDDALFHYTNATGLAGILKDKQIWATHCRHLNDYAELSIGESTIDLAAADIIDAKSTTEGQRSIIERFRKSHQSASTTRIADVFVASFSKNGNDLSQWRAYGSDGGGYSVGISRFHLPSGGITRTDANMALWLCKCQYDVDAFREEARDLLRRLAQGCERYINAYARDAARLQNILEKFLVVMLRHAGTLVPRLKHPAFEKEQEWRLIAVPMPGHEDAVTQYRPSPFGVVPYLPVDLCEAGEPLAVAEVFVGPTLDPIAGVEAARGLLRKAGYSDGLVRSSGIPYRSRNHRGT